MSVNKEVKEKETVSEEAMGTQDPIPPVLDKVFQVNKEFIEKETVYKEAMATQDPIPQPDMVQFHNGETSDIYATITKCSSECNVAINEFKSKTSQFYESITRRTRCRGDVMWMKLIITLSLLGIIALLYMVLSQRKDINVLRYLKTMKTKKVEQPIAIQQLPTIKPPQTKVVNVALDKIAKQSSTYHGVFTANLAVDGLMSTWSSTTSLFYQWWSIDLKESTNIVYMVLKGNTHQNKALVVQTRQEDSFIWYACKNIGDLKSSPFNFTCDNQTNARYVKIKSKVKCRIYIYEFEVYGGVAVAEYVNVALNKIAQQSSTYSRHYDANFAIDGLMSTLSSTKNGFAQWWSVDLRSVTGIMYMVFKGDTLHNKALVVETRKQENDAWTTCKNLGDLRLSSFKFTCYDPTNARYVKVRSKVLCKIDMYEFEVYGRIPYNTIPYDTPY